MDEGVTRLWHMPVSISVLPRKEWSVRWISQTWKDKYCMLSLAHWSQVYLEDTETGALFTQVGEGFGGGRDGDRWAPWNREPAPNIPLHRRKATVDNSRLNIAKELVRRIFKCSQHKARTCVWRDAYANCPHLIVTHCSHVSKCHTVLHKMHNYYMLISIH